STRSQNLIGCVENLLGTLFGYASTVVADDRVQPVLDVSSAVRGTFELQGLATKQRDRLGFYFAKVLWGAFGVGEIRFGGMAQDHMGRFMKECLMRQL